MHTPMQNRPIRTVSGSLGLKIHTESNVDLVPCFPACIAICSVKRHAGKNNGQSRERVHLLEGSVFNKEKEKYSKKHGGFPAPTTQEIIFCMYNKKSLVFDFKNFSVEEYGQIRNTKSRIGRLLPPFLTQICTRHAQYLLRQGLPRIPQEAISEE